MHSVSIFIGTLLICWGAYSLVMAGMLIDAFKPSDVPLEYSLGRWTPCVVSVVFLILPAGILAGGLALCWWGLAGG